MFGTRSLSVLLLFFFLLGKSHSALGESIFVLAPDKEEVKDDTEDTKSGRNMSLK